VPFHIVDPVEGLTAVRTDVVVHVRRILQTHRDHSLQYRYLLCIGIVPVHPRRKKNLKSEKKVPIFLKDKLSVPKLKTQRKKMFGHKVFPNYGTVGVGSLQ
jgi:hypothetical protein